MWTYSRQTQFALMTFTGTVAVDDAYAAAARLRDDAGSSPVRVVIDVGEADFPQRCVLVFMGVLDEVAVVDVVVIGASREVAKAFQVAWTAFTVPVVFHPTVIKWLASERIRHSVRPRAPRPLLALTG